MEGPQVSGPWLVFCGGNALGIYRPLIYRGEILFFLPCGTMSHTVLTLQVTWTHGERPISSRTATIAWTRVHAISKSSTCVKVVFK